MGVQEDGGSVVRGPRRPFFFPVFRISVVLVSDTVFIHFFYVFEVFFFYSLFGESRVVCGVSVCGGCWWCVKARAS